MQQAKNVFYTFSVYTLIIHLNITLTKFALWNLHLYPSDFIWRVHKRMQQSG